MLMHRLLEILMSNKEERQPTITVGLLWHSPTSNNLGVGALTFSQIAILSAAAKRAKVVLKLHLFGWPGDKASPTTEWPIKFSPIAHRYYVPFKSSFISQIGKCDVILDIGEGDSFTDIYGSERFWFQAGTKIICLAHGKPLVLSPQTIGPFTNKTYRRIANAIIRRCRRVYARDGLSSGYLRDNDITENAAEAIDVAFRLPYEQQVRSTMNGKLRFGLNVSGLLFNGGYDRANQFGLTLDYPLLVRELLRRYSEHDDMEVHLVNHVLTDALEIEDDRRVCAALHKEFPRTVLAPAFSDPIQAKTYIAGLDFFSGARMHACIAAFSSGVPLIPMSYSRKFNGLFGSLGYEKNLIDCRQDDTELALEKIAQAISKLPALREQISAGNDIAFTKLAAYEDYLVQLLQEYAHEQR